MKLPYNLLTRFYVWLCEWFDPACNNTDPDCKESYQWNRLPDGFVKFTSLIH